MKIAWPSLKGDGSIAARSGKKVFYGWWIVFSGTVAMALQGGLYFYGFGTFFMPLINEFGWSRASLSGAMSLARLEGGLLGPVAGYLVDRFGPRLVMFGGVIFMGAGFILITHVNSLAMFYVIYVLCLAQGVSSGIQTPIPAAVANWFIRKRSRALGILMTGTGVGGLLVPVLSWIIASYGWRTAAVTSGIIVLIAILPLSFVMRHKPEQYGYLPDGESSQPEVAAQTVELATAGTPTSLNISRAGTPLEIDFSPVEAIRTQAFWLLAFSSAIRMMVSGAIAIHLIPFLEDIGFSPELSGLFLGALGVASIVGRVGFGWLGDIYDKRYVLGVATALLVVAMLTLLTVHSWWQMVIFLAIYGPAYGAGPPLLPAIRGEYFGRKAFGTIHGTMNFVIMFGNIAGPVFAGYVFDVTGSYRLAFIIFAATCVLSLVLVLAMKRPSLASHKAAARSA